MTSKKITHLKDSIKDREFQNETRSDRQIRRYQSPGVKDAAIRDHTQLNQRKKVNSVIAHGGRCAMCGYEKSLAALEFHHVADDKLVDNMSNLSVENYKKETDKCILLCANCHREHHNGGMDY